MGTEKERGLRMRKVTYWMLAAALLVGAVGCSKKEQGQEQKRGSNLTAPVVSEDYNQGNGSIMKTKNGYYYYDVLNGALRYYDIATGKNMYLCNKPECKHDGNSFCIATNHEYAMDRIWLYSDRLYAAVVETTETQYLLKVISMALDGAEMREVATYMTVEKTGQYPKNDTDVRFLTIEGNEDNTVLRPDVGKLLIHRNKVILPMEFISLENFEDSAHYGTAILDLETEEVTYLNEEPLSRENPWAQGFSAGGNYIFYYQKEGRKNILHRYNVTDGTDESFTLQPGFDGTYVVLDEDTIAYFRSVRNIVNVYQISTGFNNVYEIGCDVDRITTDGTYLYVSEKYNYRQYFNMETMEMEEWEEANLHVLNREFEKVASVDLTKLFPKENFPEGEWYPKILNRYVCSIGDEIYFDLFQNRMVYKCKKSDLLAGQPQVEFLYKVED